MNICEKAQDYFEQIQLGKGLFYVSENNEIIDGYMSLRTYPEAKLFDEKIKVSDIKYEMKSEEKEEKWNFCAGIKNTCIKLS